MDNSLRAVLIVIYNFLVRTLLGSGYNYMSSILISMRIIRFSWLIYPLIFWYNHYIVIVPRGRKVSGEQHYFGSVIVFILIQIILLLLLHALFNLVYVKFFLYLRPAREEGPSFLARIAVIKVVVCMCFYFGLCISKVLLLLFQLWIYPLQVQYFICCYTYDIRDTS